MTTAEIFKNTISSHTWKKKNVWEIITLLNDFSSQICNKPEKSNVTFQIIGKKNKKRRSG